MFKPTKQQLEEALGQRVMDYTIDRYGDVNFSIQMEKFGYNTDPGFYADFCLLECGDLIWIPDIPTESTSPNTKITNMEELVSALEDWGEWEVTADDEDVESETE
jgi:hypothetical protein